MLTAGLTAKFYDNMDFTGRSSTRIDQTVNFSWSGSPASGIGSDTFSVRWTGSIVPKSSGSHLFYLTINEGARLYVNGKRLIDAWSNTSTCTKTASTALTGGTRYDFKLECRDNAGKAAIKLEWSGSGFSKRVIPVTAFGTARIHPGDTWRDTDGKVIDAHGGGILCRNGVYYWYGEERRAPQYVNPITGQPGMGFSGLRVYSSTDLLNWTNRGLALQPVMCDPAHDLNPEAVIERPKVIYNAVTKQYVMWFHLEDRTRLLNRVGIATSSTPTGSFAYRGSFRPLELQSRDMTLFQDDDGRAYLIFATDRNASLRIARLTDDYLGLTGEVSQPYSTPGNKREAPAMIKANGKYFLLTSGTTSWSPNRSMYAVSSDIMKPFTLKGDPFSGSGASTSYQSQPTFILPIAGKPNAFIYMGDRWLTQSLCTSRYLWMPLRINGETMRIDSPSAWNPLTAFR